MSCNANKGLARRACAAGLVATLWAMPLMACSRAGAADSETSSEAAVSLSASDGSVAHLLSSEDYVSNRDLDASYDSSSATKIALSDSGCTVSGPGAEAEGTTVTITAAGTYVVSGSVSDGQIIVNADGEKVQLVLDGASVTSSNSAALLVRTAKKVWVTLADGTRSTLASTGEFAADDELTVDGAVFCKADLTVNGGGSLFVSSAAGHGIVCKDELVLVSGDVAVEAAKHAIQAKDALCAVGGTWSLTAGTDGVHCGDDDDAEKGTVLITGGSFAITASSDGIDAANTLEVDGGELTVSAGDDGLHSEYALQIDGGVVTVSESYEGLEGSTVTVNGGEIDVTSSDDGVNAAGDPSGTATENAAENAAGAAPEGGELGQGGPGGEAPSGEAPDAAMEPPSGDAAGQQGAGGAPQDVGEQPGGAQGGGEMGAGQQPGAGGGMDDYDETAQVVINGGKLTICAGGDGIDSNGDLTVTGGETYVFGPTSDGDGSLDFPGTGTITGGVVVCAGSTGMAQNFTSAEGQASILVSASGSAGDSIKLTSSDGTVIAQAETRTSYACVLVCAPGLTAGQTYTLTCGDSATEVTPDSNVYSNVTRTQGGGGGQGGGPGGPMGDGSQQQGGQPGGAMGGEQGGAQGNA